MLTDDEIILARVEAVTAATDAALGRFLTRLLIGTISLIVLVVFASAMVIALTNCATGQC